MLQKSFGITWQEPHGLYEAPPRVPPQQTTVVETAEPEITVIDGVLLIPESQAATKMSSTAEIAEAVREAVLIRKRVDLILNEPQIIPSECRTMETIIPPTRRVERPGLVQPAVVQPAVVQPAVSQIRAIEPEQRHVVKPPVKPPANPQTAPIETVKTVMVHEEPEELDTTDFGGRVLKILSEDEAKKVKEDIKNLINLVGKAPPTKRPVYSAPLQKETKIEEPKAIDKQPDEVLVGGKRFLIKIDGYSIKVTPIDPVDDFRKLVKVGDQIRIGGNSLKVVGVTQYNMQLEPRIKR